MLWVLAEGELDSSGERKQFYETERGEWARRLALTLTRLDEISSSEDIIENGAEADSYASADDTDAAVD